MKHRDQNPIQFSTFLPKYMATGIAAPFISPWCLWRIKTNNDVDSKQVC